MVLLLYNCSPMFVMNRAASGGGRASARETIGRVAAGAIAEKWLKEKYGVEIVAWVRLLAPLTYQ